MIQLKELVKQEYINLKCKLSYVAIAVQLNESYQEQFKNHYFSETALAYLNHKKTAIENYIEAEKAIKPFLQDEASTYDKKFSENRIRDYILFSKISLDLLVCLVKLLIDGKLPQDESKYPDISKNKRKIHNESINEIFDRLIKDDWFKKLTEARHRIIHRGYQMRCSHKIIYPKQIRTVKFSLAKESLSVIKSPVIDKKYFDGINNFAGISIRAIREETVDLDLIIDGFVNRLPLFEEELYSILESELDFKTRISNYDIGYFPKDLERVYVN